MPCFNALNGYFYVSGGSSHCLNFVTHPLSLLESYNSYLWWSYLLYCVRFEAAGLGCLVQKDHVMVGSTFLVNLKAGLNWNITKYSQSSFHMRWNSKWKACDARKNKAGSFLVVLWHHGNLTRKQWSNFFKLPSIFIPAIESQRHTLSKVMNIWKSYMRTAGWRLIWKTIITVGYRRNVCSFQAKRKPEKIQACMGFEPLTSTI